MKDKIIIDYECITKSATTLEGININKETAANVTTQIKSIEQEHDGLDLNSEALDEIGENIVNVDTKIKNLGVNLTGVVKAFKEAEGDIAEAIKKIDPKITMSNFKKEDIITDKTQFEGEKIIIKANELKEGTKTYEAYQKYKDQIPNAEYAYVSENTFIMIYKDKINGKEVSVTRVVLNDPEKQIKGVTANDTYGTGGETLQSMQQRTGAVLAINGSHYLDGGYQDVSGAGNIVITNGQVVKGGNAGNMEIILMKDGTLKTSNDSAENLVSQGAQYSFASHDTRLVTNGSFDENVYQANNPTKEKQAIGMVSPGEYYIVTGPVPNPDLANYMVDKGCQFAKSMDQGGSAEVYFNGDVAVERPYGEERHIADSLCFYDV